MVFAFVLNDSVWTTIGRPLWAYELRNDIILSWEWQRYHIVYEM